jgi:hypothetical protein
MPTFSVAAAHRLASTVSQAHIQHDLVSFSNPNGHVTNLDFKLVGSIAHNDVLAQLVNVVKATTTASGTER